MPLHDWQPAPDAVVHAFHIGWIWNLARRLNSGLLPSGYLARPEESLGPWRSDPPALEDDASSAEPATDHEQGAPEPTMTPAPRLAAARPPRRLAIFSAAEERRVAVVEVVSRGNKDSRARALAMRDKVLACLEAGLQTGLIDVWPRGREEWSDVVGSVVAALGASAPLPAYDRCIASFESMLEPSQLNVYIESCAVGAPLPDLPLFLAPSRSVSLPLDATYVETFAELPAVDRARVAASAGS